MAEAAASGADEALAYDSLKRVGDLNDWGRVLERQIQFQSAGFVVAMTLGAALYDPVLLQSLLAPFGTDLHVSQATTLRLPIYLTLATALLTLLTTLRMKESDQAAPRRVSVSVAKAVRLTFQAGCWIFRTPFVLCVILAGLLFDSVIRMQLTMASQYYRLIEIPEALFGVLGSVLALFGFVIPRAARHLSARHNPPFNLFVVAGVALAGMSGICFFWPVWGILPALLLFADMYFVGFFVSHYLNRATTSERRATVLSFKGLFFNLGYGLVGLLYSLLLAGLRKQIILRNPDLSGEPLKNRVFIDAMVWFPVGFFLALLVLLIFAAFLLRDRKEPCLTDQEGSLR